jgi:hypothetical protein
MIDANELRERIAMLLGDSPAGKFVGAFGAWCHAIDDIVDGDTKTPEGIVKAFVSSFALASSTYYQQNVNQLFPIVLLIANAFLDSVAWENDEEEWRRKQADVLRNAGNEMMLAVIGIERGFDAMRQVSLLIRECSHYRHHDAEGRPI